MQIKFKKISRRQHLIVSLTASGLEVAQYHRAFTTWVCLQSVALNFAQPVQDASETVAKLQEATSKWGIEHGCLASWVMPADVVAVQVLAPASNLSADNAGLFPFELNDMKLSDFNRSSKNEQSISWIHKDWVGQLVKLSSDLGWVCDEIYARAQLFLPSLPKREGKFRVLVEGDSTERHLHMYSPSGAVVRTSKISANNPDGVALAIRREIAATSAPLTTEFCILIDSQQLASIGDISAQSVVQEFEPSSLPSLGIGLIESAQTGVEIVPTYGALTQRVQAYSLGFAIVGAVMIGALVWHDGVLQSKIDDDRRQIRKDTSPFQIARAQRLETLKMAQAIQVKSDIVMQPPVFRPLSEMMSSIAIPAKLSSYEQTASTVRISGTGATGAAMKSLFEKNPKFSKVRVVPVPDFLKSHDAVFALEMQWKDVALSVKTAPLVGGVK